MVDLASKPAQTFTIDKHQKARKWGKSSNIFQTLGGEVNIPIWTSGRRDHAYGNVVYHQKPNSEHDINVKCVVHIADSRSGYALERAKTDFRAEADSLDDRTQGFKSRQACSVESDGL